VFHGKAHPSTLGASEVSAFLTWLAVRQHVRLIVVLLYGAGLRIQECLELRVKDIDFDRQQIVVRRGKGQKDRRTCCPWR